MFTSSNNSHCTINFTCDLKKYLYSLCQGLCRGLCWTHWCTCDSSWWILQSAQLKILITFCSLLNWSRINPEWDILHLAKWQILLLFCNVAEGYIMYSSSKNRPNVWTLCINVLISWQPLNCWFWNLYMSNLYIIAWERALNHKILMGTDSLIN